MAPYLADQRIVGGDAVRGILDEAGRLVLHAAVMHVHPELLRWSVRYCDRVIKELVLKPYLIGGRICGAKGVLLHYRRRIPLFLGPLVRHLERRGAAVGVDAVILFPRWGYVGGKLFFKGGCLLSRG